MYTRSTLLLALMLAACAAPGSDEASVVIADAGHDVMAMPGQVAHFDGTESLGSDLSWTWSIVEAPADSELTDADIEGADSPYPALQPDADGQFVLEMTVCDSLGACDSDTAWVYTRGDDVSANPPVADAGADQSVASGATVYLDGTGSFDADGDIATYRWSFKTVPAGSSFGLSDINDRFTVDGAWFTPDVDGVYTVRLYVADDTSSSTDLVDITVGGAVENTPPVSDAGPDQSVRLPTSVVLDGTGSWDADGDTLSYRWNWKTLPAGSALTKSDITDRFAATAGFTPDVAGDYVVKLIVDDGTDSVIDEVTIAVRPETNTAPVAAAGDDQFTVLGDAVSLDGSASYDPDGDAVTYRWDIKTAPASSALTSADITDRYADMASFTPDVVGAYELRFVVADDLATTKDYVWVTVTETANTAPVADAGPDIDAMVGSAARPSGEGSYDPDGDTITYRWTMESVPDGSTITKDDMDWRFTVRPRFYPDVAGTYTLKLIVKDGVTQSEGDYVNVYAWSVSFADDVVPILNANCISCHDNSGSPSSGMDLQTDPYSEIVSVESQDVAGMNRVEPWDSGNSYFYHKIAGTQADVGGAGSQMPKGSDPLSEADMATIMTWIDEGALDN